MQLYQKRALGAEPLCRKDLLKFAGKKDPLRGLDNPLYCG